MSLHVSRVTSAAGTTCAAEMPTRIAVGTAAGSLRVLAASDHVLEREVPLGRSVARLAALPGTEVVAAIADRRCSVHNLATRKEIHRVDSSSARYLAVAGPPAAPGAAGAAGTNAGANAGAVKTATKMGTEAAHSDERGGGGGSSSGRARESVLVVGSSYKLRILRFADAQLLATQVVDTPNGLKVRALGNAHSASAYVVLGTRSPVLWHLSLATGQLRPVLALDAALFASAHRFSVTGTAESLLVASSTGAQLVALRPLRILRSWRVETRGATVVKSSPLGIELLLLCVPVPASRAQSPGTARAPASAEAEALLVCNPATGFVLAEERRSPAVPFGDGGAFGTLGPDLVRLAVELTVDFVAGLADPAEAASLAFCLPAELVTNELRGVERAEAARLFDSGEIDESMRRFLQIEEQETTPPFANHEHVVSILNPFLDDRAAAAAAAAANASHGAEGAASGAGAASLSDADSQAGLEPVQSSGRSIFSVRSAFTGRHSTSTQQMSTPLSRRRNQRHHELDSVAAYLVFTRRKLRLAHQDAAASAAQVDTALFRCYMLMKSPLVAPLLRSANQCDPGIVRDALLAAGKWRELVWFLRSRNDAACHRQALELLVSKSEPPETVAAYLENMRGVAADERLALAFEFARPILAARPDLAERLFYEEREGDSESVYRFLTEIDADLGRAFARHRIFAFADPTPALHNELARLLASTARAANGAAADSAAPADDNAGDAASHAGGANEPAAASSSSAEQELQAFLRSSQHIQPRALLKARAEFSPACAAILHARLGEYTKAIDIYLDEAHDLRAAQDLAEKRCYATYLFRRILYLHHSGNSEGPGAANGDVESARSHDTPDASNALYVFLNRASPNTDLKFLEVLDVLPDATSLSEVAPFLNRFVSHEYSALRTGETSAAVAKMALAESSIHLATLRKHKYTVDSLDACTVCHKRLGRAVTGVETDGNLAHYACLNSR